MEEVKKKDYYTNGNIKSEVWNKDSKYYRNDGKIDKLVVLVNNGIL